MSEINRVQFNTLVNELNTIKNNEIINWFSKHYELVIQHYNLFRYFCIDKKFKQLLSTGQHDILLKIIDVCLDKKDGHLLIQLILLYCSPNDMCIVEFITNETNSKNILNTEFLQNLITKLILNNNTFLFLYITNYCLNSNMKLPDINIDWVRTDESCFRKIHHLALDFGYFENSLREMLTGQNQRLYDAYEFDNCPLDDKYIEYVLEKNIVRINRCDYIILKRLLINNKIKLFTKLVSKYSQYITDVAKEDIITIIYNERKTLFINNHLQLIDILLTESIDFNKKPPLIIHDIDMRFIEINTEEYFFVNLIKKENIDTIRLFVEKNKIDININNGHGLRRAIYRNYTSIIQYLLSRPDIIVNKTHFTSKQYLYLETRNKLDKYMISLFERYNPAIFNKKQIEVNSKLMLTCCLTPQDTDKIKSLIYDNGADILTLGKINNVFQHPLYTQNEFILTEYCKKYFAFKRITRILFGRRGIFHNIQYKWGRRRIYKEFDELDEFLTRNM